MPTATARPRAWLTDLPVLLVAVVWGSSYLATKGIARPDAVLSLLLLRFLIAVPLLALTARRALSTLTRPELRGGLLLGCILAAVFLLETYGVVHTSATNAGLIISLTMIFTPFAEAAVARRRPAPRLAGAAALSIAGVALLTQGAGFTAPSAGDLLMLLAALVRTANVLATHRLHAVRNTDDAALTCLQLTTAVVVFAALTPLDGTTPWSLATHYNAVQWLDLLYLALMCTLLAFFVQLWAVRRTSPSRVSLLQGTEPLWAAVIGIALGGDRLVWSGFLGAALVLAGTFWGRRVTQSPAPDHDSDPDPVEDVRTPPHERATSLTP